jgi:hypothetical protein
MRLIKKISFTLIAAFILQSCGVLDLRTRSLKKTGITEASIKKGKKLLHKAWLAQGYDKLQNHVVYSYDAEDTWKGLLGKLGQIWPEKKIDLSFKYEIGTFDGRVTYKSGKKRGNSAGLQNWNYYEVKNGQIIFLDEKTKENRKKVFGIAAFQYFNEMIDRLKNAPIISYAGEKEFRNKQYDLVFCTWNKPEAHKENDQYIAWVNKKTGMLDFVQYTIRETYLKPPGYKLIGGAVEFTDFKNIDGVLIPHTQLIYAIKMRKKPKRNLHKVVISDFEFDGFDINELRPNKALKIGGNFKNKKQ